MEHHRSQRVCFSAVLVINMVSILVEFSHFVNLVPIVFVPLDQRSENESSGSNNFEITKEITEFSPSGFTAQTESIPHA